MLLGRGLFFVIQRESFIKWIAFYVFLQFLYLFIRHSASFQFSQSFWSIKQPIQLLIDSLSFYEYPICYYGYDEPREKAEKN